MVSSYRQLFCILCTREEKLGAAGSLLRIINSARAVLWDICFLYSLAGRDRKARGRLLPRAQVLQVTKTWPPAHAACSLLPSASLWFQEFGCEAKASQMRKMWASSQFPQGQAGCVKMKRSAYPHSTAEVLGNWNHMRWGWGLRRLLNRKQRQLQHAAEFPWGDVKSLELKPLQS